MAYNFGANPAVSKTNINEFKGVDFANSVAQCSPSRSPNAENIIADLAGKPMKRTGYETMIDFPARLNGIFRLKTTDDERILAHAGSFLYELRYDADNDFFTQLGIISQSMNDDRSVAFQHDGSLYILDGKEYYKYTKKNGAFSLSLVSDEAKVPIVVYSQNPDGTGGSAYQDTNVLTNRRTYSFFGTEDATEYHLSADSVKLTDGPVKCRQMDEDAQWNEITNFTVDRENGVITFATAPGKSPAAAGGIDNVEIEVEVEQVDFSEDDKEARKYMTADLVKKCTIAILYGTNGSADRVFVSGNPDAPNFQYWSAINDPTYFPGKNYMYLGQDDAAIIGYSIINDTLVIHKEDNDQDKTTFMVNGQYDSNTNKTNFAITGSINGIGAVSKNCFARLDTEPLFVSKQGVYAITTQYLTAERYAQVRSWYVNPRLIKEPNLEDAVAIEYNNFYYLGFPNGHVYVADGRQKTYERNAPQSNFQYEWYYLTNIPVRLWWQFGDKLYFGTEDGELKRFYLKEEDTAAHPVYNDDGEAITAFWETPYFEFNYLSRYKTLKGFWVMTAEEFRRSSIQIYYRYKGRFIQTKDKPIYLDTFDFNDIDFERFTFITDDGPYVMATNRKAKKFVTIQFRLENTGLNEGFGFYEAEATYILNGKNKG